MKRRGTLEGCTRKATLAAYKVGDVLWIDDMAVAITEYDAFSGRIRWVQLIPSPYPTVADFLARTDTPQ